MKRAKIRQTIEYVICVPDDWNKDTSAIIRNTEDKEFSRLYDKIYDIEDCYNINTMEDIYDRTSVPDILRTIHTTIIDK